MIGIRDFSLPLLLLLCSTGTQAADEPRSGDFTPPLDEYSWVQLDTGEWLKGEIVSLYDDTLAFDSDHFDNLELDLEDIQSIYGRGIFELTLEGDTQVSGTLQMDGQRILMTYSGETVEYNRDDLVSITPSVERERDRWIGDVSLGINVQQGNSDISEYNVIAGLQRRTPVSRVKLDYIGNTNINNGERITDSQRVNLAIDRFTGRRLYWRPVSVQYYRDKFQNIAHQATVDTGIGYHLIDSRRTDWEIQAGVGRNYLANLSVTSGDANNDWSSVGTLGSVLTIDITSSIEYELLVNMTFLEEVAGKYQHHVVSTLSTDLIGDIDLDISIIWDRTEKPQGGEDGVIPEQDDYRVVVSFNYDF